MKCIMNRGVYLRASGRLPCYCGSGETVTLGRLPDGTDAYDFFEQYYQKGSFAHIRRKMTQGMVPWPGICDQCTYLDTEGEYTPGEEDKTLEWLHWEPSYRCNLDCQWCHGQQREGSGDVALLSLERFKRMLEGFYSRGIKLSMGNVCGVGEPTLNPRVWDMVRLVKEKMGGDILLSTNGNGPYSDDIVSSGLDKIKIAVDAVRQELYQKYRERGSLLKVMKFTRSLADAKMRLGVSTPIIIWQYILFNFNDSDEDLITLQKMAQDNGVDRLKIVHTRCDNYSQRLPDDFPARFPDIEFFPISRYSQITLNEANDAFCRIESLADEGKKERTARETVKLINRIYHRLALGVKTYNNLLALTKGPKHLQDGNLFDLDASEYSDYCRLIKKNFELLETLYGEMGFPDQADAYRRYHRTALSDV